MKKLSDFKGKHIYFIGIGGVSMSGLALIVRHYGAKVSGSDLQENIETEKLKNLGIKINFSHKGENIDNDLDYIVYTSAIKSDNEELLKGLDLGIVCLERSEFLGIISKCFNKVIAVSGTHGKTTTSAMISEILLSANLNPTIHIGGESVGKGNTIVGDNQFLVVEACEYKESFKYLDPYIGIITNIEPDHLDYYKDINSINRAFNRFASRCENVIVLDDLNIKHKHKSVVFDDWQIKQVEFIFNGYNFNVFYKNEFYGSFRINMLGIHNVTNALFAIATAHRLGIGMDVINKALAGFKGVERRYETVYRFKSGCNVIIDYAHHPTELEFSINGIKYVYDKILYVFQPHTYSRTVSLFDEFVEVINSLPNVVLFKTYPAREKLITGGTAMDLFSNVNTSEKYYFESIDSLMTFIQEKSADFDCVLILGAGNLGEILKRNYTKL